MNLNTKQRNVLRLLAVSAILIVFFGALAYKSSNDDHLRKNPESEPLTLMQFLNNSNSMPSSKSIIVGMMSGIVFGFVDNAGLFFGMDALDPYLPGGELTKAGLGNTYSDALGSFLSVFIGTLIQKSTGVENTPLWADTVGIIVGCLLGIWIPRGITGKS